ncbi:S8 family serine peptidase [Aquabacterium sp.]|uniref:S8 family serine peptidase n=1 Tax=Aquabacterium sp. TaxID=1872578 RepID=UPI002C5C57EC|nr:S8 family serine peptidase [Aquabacterium sp.]HSW09202.1 S8 family serine peptidase [Aquabacterium sp.]
MVLSLHGDASAADALWPAQRAPGPRFQVSPADLVSGTPDLDYLEGTDGSDTLRGLAGDDSLQGYAGNDLLDGGAGIDTAYYDDAISAVTVNLLSGSASGGSGTDTLVSVEDVWGSLYNDSLIGNYADNTLYGDFGDDLLQGGGGDDTLSGDTGDDTLDGGTGIDAADYFFAFGAVTVNLAKGRASGADGNDQLISIESVFGSFYDDTLTGDEGVNFLFGSFGDDTIDGGFGDDFTGFLATLAEATVRYDPATGWLTVSSELDGTDILRSVEMLYFGDDFFEASQFTAASPPTPLLFSPASGSTDVLVGSNLQLTFNETIQRGTGTLLLRDGAGTVVASFDAATSSQLTLEGANLSIDPPARLLRNTSYTLELPAGAVLDAEGNPNAAHASYHFRTHAAAEVSLPETLAVSEGTGTLQVMVSLSDAMPQAVQVTLHIDSTGTAGAADADLSAASRVLSFAPGQTQLLVDLAIFDDGLFEPNEGLRLTLDSPSGAVLGNDAAMVTIVDNDNPGIALPDDPLRGQQWHLYPGTGANVLSVWPEYTGAGVRIGVFDQGIDASHADLHDNIDQAAGRHTVDLSAGGNPVSDSDNHGTAVAGVIAADRNTIGGIGVAYDASLVSLYSALDADSATIEIQNAFAYAQELDILNDSWGYAPQYYLDAPWAFEDNFIDAEFSASGAALKALAEQGRGGLGTIVVQSAGNSFEFGDDTNLHNFQNSRYIVTVAATDYVGEATSYSSPGASILVAAPGGDGGDEFDFGNILTTDRPGSQGYGQEDMVRIAGTSFSAPVVSGVVALMLEANPQLGYRDVQQILASSAHISAAEDNLWRYNGGQHWNGGGLHFDAEAHDLGFGLVDAHAAVRLAETWGSVAATSANDVELSATRATPAEIPDGRSSLTQSIAITEAIEVERVEVTVDIEHDYIGDLSLLLVSPAGTSSWLLSRPGQNALTAFGVHQEDIHFTFNTVLSMGESSLGDWSLTVYDKADADVGSLRSWTLNLVGKPVTADDVYLYTDEYAEAVLQSPTRATLADDGGTDTINAAAITSDSIIDLVAGSPSWLDGQSFAVAAGTAIENALGGDGADALLGNALANALHGMRGSDELVGRGGDDRLDGGAGVDLARYTGLRASFDVQRGATEWTITDRSGAEGLDTLLGIERLAFGDAAIAYDTGAADHGGQVAQILRALFGSSFLANPLYVGIGLDLLDQGISYGELVALAIGTGVFEQLAGSRSNTDFVKLVYRNVVGSPADAASLAEYTGLLDSGVFTQAALGQLACQAMLNVQSVELAGLAQTGIEYLPAQG